VATQGAKQSKIMKRYEGKPFVLTARKFARIVEIAKERMARIGGPLPLAETFAVTLTNTKDLTLNHLDDVLALDNSVKNPVREIAYSIWAVEGQDKPHWIGVDFDAGAAYFPIAIVAESDNLGWMQETVGALEEQVERTIPTDFAYSLRTISSSFPIVSLGAFLVVVSIFASLLLRASEVTKSALGVSEKATEQLRTVAGNVKTDSDKIDFVYRYLSATVQPQPSELSFFERYLTDYRSYLVVVPLLVAIVSVVVALGWFYPSHVFVWGDYEEHYNKLIERRRLIWYGVIVALIIGVLGNFFVLGVTGFSPAK
jgi:hypothetical protein